jgi:hypothetical protein
MKFFALTPHLLVYTTVAVMLAFGSFGYTTVGGAPTWACIVIGICLVFVVWTWFLVIAVAMVRRDERDESSRSPGSGMPPHPNEFR